MNKHIISNRATIKEALSRLDQIRDQNLTLFVINEQNEMVGTITDGDIRRALLKGVNLNAEIINYFKADFFSIEKGKINFKKLKEALDFGITLVPLLGNDKKIIKIYDFKKLKSIVPVDVVIMAGGLGKRLLPLTANTPKPMLPLGDKPIIEHNIDNLISYGVENIYISVSYLSEQIIDYFGNGQKKGVSINYIFEDKPLGTIGAVRNFDNYQNDHILVMNSDLFTNINFEKFFIEHTLENADITVATIPYEVAIPYAILEHDKNNVLAFKEKPHNTYFANAGIYLIKKEVLNYIPKNEFFNMTDLMQTILDKKQKLIHFPIYGYWIDIGQHADYQKAQEIVKHFF